jgi:hypothetical protein
MKRKQIKAMLKKGNFSPFMVAKLMFNDFWRNNHLQEPLLSGAEKQSLINKMAHDEYYQYKKWKEWFIDIDEIYSTTKEFYLESETKLFQLLWFIEKDLRKVELRPYFKNMFPVPVTERQYKDIKKKDREDKLKKKYSIVYCLIKIIEDKLPGPEKVTILEDYICQDNDTKIKDRKIIAGLFKKAVEVLFPLIDKRKIISTKKSHLLPALKATLKKKPDQIAEILLAAIYADVKAPVKILETSAITGDQLYKNFKEWAKYIDTFHPETGGGYAIVQEPTLLFLDKKGHYKTISPVDDFINGQCNLEYLSKVNGTYAFISTKLEILADRFRVFQFNRMVLDILSDKLTIPLNHGNEKIGMESLISQAEKLEVFRDLLFCNLIRVTNLNKDLKKRFSALLSEYQDRTVDQYYPCQKVVEFCKSKINKTSEYSPEWYYDIKDFYMKEEKIKEMSAEEIESLKSMGNKKQVKHFMDLVKQSNQA